MSPRAPTMTEVFREALEARLAGVHVCLPARVEAYDATTQTADCKPAVRGGYRDVEDNERVEDFPVLPGVPVACARAGRAFVHMPVAAGDFVTLVFCERGFARWRERGGVSNPDDLRLHGLTGAIAMPVNLYPSSDPLVGLNGSNVSMGFDNGAQIHIKPDGTVTLGSEHPLDDVATALKVGGNFDNLVPVLSTLGTELQAFSTALSLGVSPTAAAIGVLGGSGWPHSTASSKVKIDP